MRKTYYFSFMQSSPLKDYYFAAEDMTYEEARNEMVKHFGDKWAFQYDTLEALGAEIFNLKRIN